MSNWVGFQVVPQYFEEELEVWEGGVNNKVEGDNGQRRICFPPPEIMFQSYLDRRRADEREGNHRPVKWHVI